MNLHRLIAALVLALVAGTGALMAQGVPQGFSYQAIARDASGAPLTNQAMIVRISINSGANTDYIETHQVTTNAFGLFTLTVGRGTPSSGTFAAIDWSIPNKEIETEINIGGAGFVNIGSSQLWSVPYALSAGTVADLALDDLSDVAAESPQAGQALKWNGTTWAPSNDATGFVLPVNASGVSVLDTALISIAQTGQGVAARFIATNNISTQPALHVLNLADGFGFHAESRGDGGSGLFSITQPSNTAPALAAITSGNGSAGLFVINNRESDSAAVHGITYGEGAGIRGHSFGNGATFGVYGLADGECISDPSLITAYCPTGVYGQSNKGPGVYGFSTESGPGLLGFSQIGRIIEGRSPSATPNVSDVRFYVGNNGRTYTDSGFFTPGVHSSAANGVAELVASGDNQLAVGDVAVITPAGSIVQSTDTNQTTVIGVVVANSAVLGGNGLNDLGMPTNAAGTKLAVAGIVNINVTDEGGAIAPGELLVTSSTDGYAMAAGANPAPGTVVAKALEALPQGVESGTIRAIVMMR